MLVTMHGTIMVFFVAMPILLAAFGNFLIPLMIGAKDMAFPQLNMLSFWVFALASLVLFASFFVPGGAAAGGWTSDAPHHDSAAPFASLLCDQFFHKLGSWESRGRNPWHANTLEWTTDSPPPHGNFATIPTVYRGATITVTPRRMRIGCLRTSL